MTFPLRRVLRGGQRSVSAPLASFRAAARPHHDERPPRAPVCRLPRSPLNIHGRLWYGVWKRRLLSDGRGDDEVLRARLLRWRRPNGRLKDRDSQEFLPRPDPDGALVLPAKRRARTTGSADVPRTAAGEPSPLLPRASRHIKPLQVDPVRDLAEPLLFPMLVGRYHYPRGRASRRRSHVLSGVPVDASPRSGRLPAVLHHGTAHGAPGPLGLLRRHDSGAESPAPGQQQRPPVADARRGEEPRHRRVGAWPPAVGDGLAATPPARALPRRDTWWIAAASTGARTTRSTAARSVQGCSTAHGPAPPPPPCWRTRPRPPRLACGARCEAATAKSSTMRAVARALQMNESHLARELDRHRQEFTHKLLHGSSTNTAPGNRPGHSRGYLRQIHLFSIPVPNHPRPTERPLCKPPAIAG